MSQDNTKTKIIIMIYYHNHLDKSPHHLHKRTTPRHHQHTSNDDPDPLELKKLSLNYDYLMYKIKDYINTLTEQTYQSILSKQYQINQGILNDQLNLFDNYETIDEMLKTISQLKWNF